MITVKQIMSVGVKTLKPDNSLADAMTLMTANGIHHVPIVDKDRKVIGLVSHRDVLAASDSSLHTDGIIRDPTDVKVEEFMTQPVMTVDGRAGLREAALFLQKHQYGCLPVVTDNKLTGIITDSDYVSVAIDLLEQIEETEPDDF